MMLASSRVHPVLWRLRGNPFRDTGYAVAIQNSLFSLPVFVNFGTTWARHFQEAERITKQLDEVVPSAAQRIAVWSFATAA
jgi:hypothetical protein